MKPRVNIVENDTGWEFTVKSPLGNTKTFMVGKDGAFEWDQNFMLEWAGYRHCSLCQGTGKYVRWDGVQKLRFSSWCDCFQKQFFHIFPIHVAEVIYNHLKLKTEKEQEMMKQPSETVQKPDPASEHVPVASEPVTTPQVAA